jgi:hypothetical protein
MEQPICNICEEVLGDRPRTELLCHHFCHSECLFTNVRLAIDFSDVECVTCRQPLLPPVEEPEGEEEEEAQQEDNASVENASVDSRTRIQTLWLTNDRFKASIKAYHKATRDASKPRVAFTKLLAQKKAELAPRFLLMKAQYEGLTGVKKDEIKESQEYKEYRKSLIKYTGIYTRLRQNYRIHFYDLRYLRGFRGLRSLGRGRCRWRESPSYMIRRAFRLRF